MKFTQIPSNTFQNLQMNAGILVDTFNPETAVIGNILGATTGGINFTDAISYMDFGDDIDNCPKNMMELKRIESHEVTMGGTFVTIDATTAHLLAGAADADGGHVVPRNDLLLTDFTTLWWIGDYSDVNTGTNAGFLAIKLTNALNTGGFQIQSQDKGKGQFAFTFTGHYSMNAQDVVPYEIYVKSGIQPAVNLDKTSMSIAVGGTGSITATTTPTGETITWTSSNTSKATVANGTVTGVAAGTANITASITVDETVYSATCVVTVTAGA